MSDESVEFEEEELNPEKNKPDADPEAEDEEKDSFKGDEEGEELNPIPENPLVQDMIPQCLSMLCKIGTGLSHAFVKMMCNDMELTNVEHIKNFIHVRYVDISGNLVDDITPLNHLTHLLYLKADKNNIKSIDLESRPYLQIVNLANNKISSLDGIDHPHLTKLNLNFNQIASSDGLNGKILTNLTTLELRGNKLDSTKGLGALKSLQSLYLAANQLTKLEGLDGLEDLQILHVRDNQIEEVDGFGESMKRLQYVNLRGNSIKKLAELKKLVVLPLLRALVLSENPCTEEDNFRVEVLIILRRLVRLDKDEFSDEDRADAEEIFNQRKEEEFQKGEEEEEEEQEEENDEEA